MHDARRRLGGRAEVMGYHDIFEFESYETMFINSI
jgi:hypothetical protein